MLDVLISNSLEPGQLSLGWMDIIFWCWIGVGIEPVGASSLFPISESSLFLFLVFDFEMPYIKLPITTCIFTKKPYKWEEKIYKHCLYRRIAVFLCSGSLGFLFVSKICFFSCSIVCVQKHVRGREEVVTCQLVQEWYQLVILHCLFLYHIPLISKTLARNCSRAHLNRSRSYENST